jgi:exosortase
VRRNRLALGLAAAAYCLLFGITIAGLVLFWYRDGDYSFGFLIPPACAIILWRSRAQVAAAPARRSLAGLAVLLLGIGLYFVGRARMTDFFLRAGVYVTLIGSVWFALGPGILRACPFPFFFLAFAFPPPAFLLGPLRQALRGIATSVSADVLAGIGYEVVRAGNTLVVEGHPLEVADACSGIRSLMVIVAAAVFYAWLFRAGWIRGAILTLTAIPVTIAVNILRIMIVAVALMSFDIDLTGGIAHDALSVGVFGISLAFLYASLLFYDWLVPRKKQETAP